MIKREKKKTITEKTDAQQNNDFVEHFTTLVELFGVLGPGVKIEMIEFLKTLPTILKSHSVPDSENENPFL